MNSQKGVTLTSLAIYIILVLIIVGILATVTANFQSNIKSMNQEGINNSEVDKFNTYFLKEVKKQGNSISKVTDSEIVFTTNNKYTFREGSIYLNDNIKIAENIEKCVFSSNLQNGKTVITVTIKAINAQEKAIEYVLSNQNVSATYEDENSYINRENPYIEIEYIESTGTQYIDTGFKANQDTKIDMNVSFHSNITSAQALFCSRTTMDLDYFCGWLSGQTFRYHYGNNKSSAGEVKAELDKIYNVTTDKAKMYVDNVITAELSDYDFQSTQNLWIFASYRSENYGGPIENVGYYRLHSFKIYDDNNLVRDYIPAIDESGVACLYDKVENKYYYNQGTDEFIAGPEKQ